MRKARVLLLASVIGVLSAPEARAGGYGWSITSVGNTTHISYGRIKKETWPTRISPRCMSVQAASWSSNNNGWTHRLSNEYPRRMAERGDLTKALRTTVVDANVSVYDADGTRIGETGMKVGCHGLNAGELKRLTERMRTARSSRMIGGPYYANPVETSGTKED